MGDYEPPVTHEPQRLLTAHHGFVGNARGRRPRFNFEVEQLVRASSFVIRSIPTNRSFLGATKIFFVHRSSSLRAYQFKFDFYCRRPRLRWSASAFPDLLTRHMLFEGTYDDEVVTALKNLIRPGDTVYDIGGHHGLMTVIAARSTGPTGVVVTFEPNPHARQQIRRHTALNRVMNVILEDIALSDEGGEASFFVQAGDVSWNSTLIDGYVEDQDNRFVECITVKTKTLDEYVAETHYAPRLIKIDTEGSEIRILKGAESTIANHRPIVIMEMNPVAAHAARTTISDYTGFWGERSYRLGVLGTNVLGRYTFGDLEPFDEFKHTSTKGYANVICIPEEAWPQLVGSSGSLRQSLIRAIGTVKPICGIRARRDRH